MMMFHREKNVLVIATKFNTAANLVKKVKAIIKNLPEWLRISTVDIDNRTSFVLSNGFTDKSLINLRRCRSFKPCLSLLSMRQRTLMG